MTVGEYVGRSGGDSCMVLLVFDGDFLSVMLEAR
jgi:hypothetical protein